MNLNFEQWSSVKIKVHTHVPISLTRLRFLGKINMQNPSNLLYKAESRCLTGLGMANDGG